MSSNRFSLNSVKDEDIEIPKPVSLVSRAPSAPPAAEPEREREEVPEIPIVTHQNGANRALRLAEQKFKPAPDRRATSMKLDPWLDDALNQKVYQLKMQGFRKITREAVVADALVKYLEVKPPAQV